MNTVNTIHLPVTEHLAAIAAFEIGMKWLNIDAKEAGRIHVDRAADSARRKLTESFALGTNLIVDDAEARSLIDTLRASMVALNGESYDVVKSAADRITESLS